MAEDHLCANCAAWLCGKDDAWCGECGTACAQLELRVRPGILETGLLSPRLYFNLENASCASLEIDGLEKPDWLSIDEKRPTRLAPFDKVYFWAEANTLNMDQPDAAGIIVRTPAGQASTELMVIEKKPALVCVPAELEVWATADRAQKTLSLSIKPRAGQLKLHSISADPSGGLRVLEGVQDGQVISPSQSAEIQVEVDASRFGAPTRANAPSGTVLSDYHRARLMGSAEGGDWFREHHPYITLHCRNLREFEINPTAKLYFERSGYGDFLALDQGGSMLVFPSFKLELASSRTFLEGVFQYPQGAATLHVAQPAVVQARGEEWVLQQLGAIKEQPAASLSVAYRGPHSIQKTALRVAILVRNPPQLRWANQQPVYLFERSHQKLSLVFFNQHPDLHDGGTTNADLRFHSVALRAPAAYPDIPIRLLSELPSSVRGGESCTVEFDLNLENVTPSQSSPLNFNLEVESNAPRLPVANAAIFVQQRQRSFGALAIDFGSSNTCCAIFERDENYKMLTLDGEETVSPTLVRYMDLTGPMPVIETGASVKQLAATSDRVAASTVGELKQKLGEIRQDIPVRPYNSDQTGTRRASQAAADYLHHVREMVEVSRNLVFQDFILTHPARCSLRQYRNLALALKQAFHYDEKKKPTFLQEPLAALIPFMADMAERVEDQRASNGREPTPKQLGYTVASFDLGGGTTDIALVRVAHRWVDSGQVEHVNRKFGQMEIRPEIRHCDGVRYGGEDLTTYIEEKLQQRFEALLKKEKPGLCLIDRQKDKEMTGAPPADVLRNRFALREAAEKFKASLSEDGKHEAPKELTLRVQVVETLESTEQSFDFKALCALDGISLELAFLEFARDKILKMARLLEAAVRKEGDLDYIQLSGKTAFLPVVREVLSGLFRETRITRAGKPKECVVAGACLSRSMAHPRAGRRLFLPEGIQRTTSRIGVRIAVLNAHALFLTILPVDTVVPDEGLTRDHPRYWDGAEPVTIWENLGADDTPQETSPFGPQLNRVGTWEPERTLKIEGPLWALRLTLKEFDLSVGAISPSGEYVAFRLSEGEV